MGRVSLHGELCGRDRAIMENPRDSSKPVGVGSLASQLLGEGQGRRGWLPHNPLVTGDLMLGSLHEVPYIDLIFHS